MLATAVIVVGEAAIMVLVKVATISQKALAEPASRGSPSGLTVAKHDIDDLETKTEKYPWDRRVWALRLSELCLP